MADIGQQLFQPEDGWNRYDSTDNRFIQKGSEFGEHSECYDRGFHVVFTNVDNYIKFRFIGTKFRFIGSSHSYTYRCGKINVYVDGKLDGSFNQVGPTIHQVFMYQSKDLDNSEHVVEIIGERNSEEDYLKSRYVFDCIDTDGQILEYIPYIETVLDKKTSLDDMEVGDIIPCRYTTSTNGRVGVFSELGTCSCEEINTYWHDPFTDGKFYFIKVDDDKFIADRNVQFNINWEELNRNNIIDGLENKDSDLFNVNSSLDCKLTIPNCGVAYNDNGECSLVSKNLGGWPECNDWDRYIWKGDLNGKVTPSDNGIWNYYNTASLSRERSKSGIKLISGSTPLCPDTRGLICLRGFIAADVGDLSAKRLQPVHTGYSDMTIGFRPMLKVISFGGK